LKVGVKEEQTECSSQKTTQQMNGNERVGGRKPQRTRLKEKEREEVKEKKQREGATKGTW
jgi:hypothetical protein